MIIWNSFTLDSKKKDHTNRFSYTNNLLQQERSKESFNLNNLKKREIYFAQYNFFKDKIKNNSLFLSSGYGYYEYLLKRKYKNFYISDKEKFYLNYYKKNKMTNYIQIDVLKEKDFKKIKFKLRSIILNNVEYLFSDKQLLKCLKNIKNISNHNTTVYVIFRSRFYSFLTFFDKFLLPTELFLKKIVLKFIGKKRFLNKNFHGYRRKNTDFENILKKNFKIIDTSYFLHSLDYNRSIIIKKLKLGRLLSYLFLKSHPYLNIYTLKIK